MLRIVPLMLVFLTLFPAWELGAQVIDPTNLRDYDPDDPDAEFGRSRRTGPQQQRKSSRDTFGIFAFQVSNPNEEEAFADSLLNGWQRYEADRAVDFDYATLGIVGSAAYPLRYRSVERMGLDVGFHQFDLYQKTGENMSFFRQERPYTQLQFIQGSEQRDIMLDATFSRNFADGVNFVLDYHRNSQRGSQDQYPNQNLRNTNLATGFWVNHGGGKYDAFVSFAANTYEQQQNGGVLQPPDREGAFVTPQSSEVYIDDAFLRQSHREWMVTQYLKFGGQEDSLGKRKRAFTLSHQLRLLNFANRLSVENNTSDTAFFNQYPTFFVDDRGQRHRTELSTISNSLRLSTFRAGGGSANQAAVQKDVLEVGLIHAYHRVRQEPRDSVVNNLMLTARAGFRPSERLRFVADGRLNLLDQVGDYRIEAAGSLDLGRWGKLELNFLNQLYTPSVVQEQYWVTGTRLYRNNFSKTLDNRLEGAIVLPVVNVRVGAAYQLLTNLVYWGEDGLPRQNSAGTNVLQLTAERDFAFGNFRFDNRLLLQSTDQEIIPLPSIVGEHAVYYAGKWFGVLNVNVGLDARLFSGFTPYYFNPITQQFQLQSVEARAFNHQVDAFFSMRVTRFRFMAKYIQLSQIWQDELLYLTHEYPNPDGALRIGISWRLVD